MTSAYKPCTVCGHPTASELGICQRTQACNNEYHRLFFRSQRERRNEAVRRQRQAQKGEPSVYAIWFPVPQVLKVGFTVHTQESIFVAVARTKARRRNWDTRRSGCIWKEPGDLRTEAWIQATLAFRWRAAFEQKQDRLCEWFQVGALQARDIGTILHEVYEGTPSDLLGVAC